MLISPAILIPAPCLPVLFLLNNKLELDISSPPPPIITLPELFIKFKLLLTQ